MDAATVAIEPPAAALHREAAGPAAAIAAKATPVQIFLVRLPRREGPK